MFIYCRIWGHSLPGDAVRGLDSVTAPKPVRGNWPLWPPEGPPWPPRVLPWPPVADGTDDVCSSKVSNTTLRPKF